MGAPLPCLLRHVRRPRKTALSGQTLRATHAAPDSAASSPGATPVNADSDDLLSIDVLIYLPLVATAESEYFGMPDRAQYRVGRKHREFRVRMRAVIGVPEYSALQN